MVADNPWDAFHAAWRRVEAVLRGGAGQAGVRGPIADVIEAAVRNNRLTSQTANEIDAFRRLRNIDAHEGMTGTGARLCTPNQEAVARLTAIAEQLECPLRAAAIMTKAATCSANMSLGDVLSKFKDGADVVYYRDGKRWCAFDRAQVSRIVERTARGATTTVDLARSVSDHAAKIGVIDVVVLTPDTSAKQALQALRAVIAAGDPERYQAVLVADGRAVFHLRAGDLDAAERRLAM